MSTIHNLNNLELKAMRQSLGLTVAEASELNSIKVSKRFFQYIESGERTANQDINDVFFNLGSQYHLALSKLTDDINEHCKTSKKPVLPFFHSFELFKEKTGNQYPHFWKIYQSVIGHLLLIGAITTLDDNAEIPKNFSIWWWLDGKYEIDTDDEV